MKKQVILILYAFFLISANSREIYTTHPQVGYSLTQMSKLYKDLNAKPVNLYEFNISVHDFEPTTKDLMKLKGHSPLIAGPLNHQRWISKAKQANLLPKKSFVLNFLRNQEDHFWLSSHEGCLFEEKILNILNQWNIFKGKNQKLFCNWMKEKEGELSAILKAKNINHVILTHNALKKIFSKNGIKVLSLIGDDHHHEISSSNLKKSHQWLNGANQVLVVKEKGFNFPKMLSTAKAQVIQWDPLIPRPQPLVDLINKIKEIK